MRGKLLIALVAVLIVSGLSVLITSASSHREAPLVSQDPAADTTDVYAWVDANDPTRVNLVANHYPAQEPNGGPNFYRFGDDVLYEIHIDNDGDAVQDISYQFDFDTTVQDPNTFLYNTGPVTSLDDPDWNIRQSYTLSRVDHASRDVVIDFEGMSKGDIVDEIASGSGSNGDLNDGIVKVFGANSKSEAGTNAAMIFDAACSDGCSGQDDDLNKPESGNVLIVSEDLDSDDPDDDGQGGQVSFDFSGLGGGTVAVADLDVLDVEDGGTIVLRAGGEDGSIVNTIPIPKMADNGLDTIQIAAAGVDFMSVKIIGSGAVDNIRLQVGNGTSVLGSNLATPPVNVGPGSTPDYETLADAAVHSLDGDAKVFAGQRDDPFYVDLGAIFDLLDIRTLPGNAGGGVDGLGGFNVQTIALQVPIDQITDGDAIIGVWATASRPSVRILQPDGGAPAHDGPYVQVSRLGMPLVNEVVIPLGEKDRFNASLPSDDAQFLDRVTEPEVAGLLNLIYGDVVAPVPVTGRDDLVAVFLTGVPGLNQPVDVVPSEMLRLNTSVAPNPAPERLGALAGDLAGFPNGRRLGDDVVDVIVRGAACGYGDILEGLLGLCNLSPNNQLGDGVDQNDVPFLAEFPYVGTPHQGFEHTHHSDNSAPLALSIGTGLMASGVALGGIFTMRRRRILRNT